MHVLNVEWYCIYYVYVCASELRIIFIIIIITVVVPVCVCVCLGGEESEFGISVRKEKVKRVRGVVQVNNEQPLAISETHLVGLDFFSNTILCSSEGFYSLQ